MMRTLSRFERRWAFAALGAIYPSHASRALSVGVCDLDLGEFLRDLFAHVPLTAALGLRAAIWMVAVAPLFVLGRWATVVSLAPGERQSLVERLLSSSSYGVRQLVVALKAVGGLYFGGARPVKEAIFGGGEALLPAASLTAPRGHGEPHVQHACR